MRVEKINSQQNFKGLCKETGQYRKVEPALKSLLVNNFK